MLGDPSLRPQFFLSPSWQMCFPPLLPFKFPSSPYLVNFYGCSTICLTSTVQGSAKRHSPGLVNFIAALLTTSALIYLQHSRNLGTTFIAEPCTYLSHFAGVPPVQVDAPPGAAGAGGRPGRGRRRRRRGGARRQVRRRPRRRAAPRAGQNM